MDPSTAQEIASQTLQSMLGCTKVPPPPQQQLLEKKPRPADQQSLKCPRCDSTNTKFCYYNNYSLSQPRYFCKACRRYWTKGGTLRNVPVGGGCRKNKRSSSSASSRSRSQDQSLCSSPNPLPSLTALPYDPNDLSLAIARLQKQANLGIDDHHHHDLPQMMCNPNNAPYGFLETPESSGLFQNMYSYGAMNHGASGSLNLGGGHHVGEMGISYEGQLGNGVVTSSAAATTGRDNEGESSSSRGLLWSFPWQVGGDFNQAGGNMGGFGSSWHGLLNSPLM